MNPLVASLSDADPRIVEAVIASLIEGRPKHRSATLEPKAEEALAAVLPRLTRGQGAALRLATSWGSRHLNPRRPRWVSRCWPTWATSRWLKISGSPPRSATDQLPPGRPRRGGVSAAKSSRLEPPPRSLRGSSTSLGESGSSRSARHWSAGSAGSPLRRSRRRSASCSADRPRPPRLLNAIEKQEVSLSDLSLDQTQSLAAHPESKIRQRARALFARGGGLPNADRQKVIEELTPLVLRKGDPALGKVIFQQQCLKCHTHGSGGGKVGPDLTGMAVHPKEELLVHILDPSRSVEGNYPSIQRRDHRRPGLRRRPDFRDQDRDRTGRRRRKTARHSSRGRRGVASVPEIDHARGLRETGAPEGLANLLEFLTQLR